MKFLIVIILIFILLLIVPVPIKFSIFYSSKDYYLKIYKFNIISKLNHNKKQKKNMNKKNKNFNNKKNSFLNYIKETTLTTSYIKNSINRLKKRNYKPKIKIEGFLNYSLGDSSKTAISYGIFSSICPYIYKFISIIMKFRKSNFIINPIFKDDLIFVLKLNGIITVSIGQIIYTIIILVITFIRTKEVSLLGEIYE